MADKLRNFINGEPAEPADGRYADLIDPSSGEVFASAAVPNPAKWEVIVAPSEQAGLWLPTGRIDRFELTLRAYLPDDGGIGNMTRDQLPSIVKEGC